MAKKSSWKNEDLLEAFDLFNSRYFRGGLTRPVILAFRPLDGLGHTFRLRSIYKAHRSKGDSFGITISRELRYSRRLWATTLLHEMVHLEQGNLFSCSLRGRHFNRRMKQLASDGAFNGLW